MTEPAANIGTTSDAHHSQPAAGPLGGLWHAFITRDRFSLTAGSIVCALLALWLSRTLETPAYPGRAGSLLQQPLWPVAMGLAWLVVIGGSALVAVFASRVHYDGALFCGCIGLTALSVRMGALRFALFEASGPGAFLAFAVELILLFTAVAIAWFILRRWARGGLLPAEKPVSLDETPDEPLDQKLLATAAHAMVTIVAMMLLSHSDAKPQVIGSLLIACYLGALAAHHFVPTMPSAWFWSGPLVVGLIGYVSQYFGASEWMIGDVRGFFAPLARPMPLDYAGAGVAGALIGYWTSRSWQRSHAELETT